MKHRLLLVISLTGLMFYGGAAAASAAPAQPRSSAQGSYCVAEAEPAGSMVTPTATCYSTFSASIRAATGGRVRLPASARPGSVTPDEVNAWATAAPATTFILSIDYVDSNFGGNSLTWTETSNCGSFQAASMPSGWNDVVSSIVTSADCANSLFQNINFGGSRLDISKNTSRATIGSFNDLTSSEKWCTSKPC